MPTDLYVTRHRRFVPLDVMAICALGVALVLAVLAIGFLNDRHQVSGGTVILSDATRQ